LKPAYVFCTQIMSTKILPPFLRSGDCIGIVATARWMASGQLDYALAILTSWGFRVRVSEAVEERFGQLAGNDEKRREELQKMLDDPEISAILIARGGYGTVRIIDDLNWSRFYERPKWICGYSDITVLLSHLTNQGIACIHSTMPISFPDATVEALGQLRDCLTGSLTQVTWETTHWSDESEGLAGNLVGGNLSVLYSQLGSKSQINARNSVLFLEDVDEHLYHIDRMCWALRRSGIFESIRAVIIGGMTQIKDNTIEFGFKVDNPWGFEIHEIIRNSLPDSSIPLFGGFPAGHQNDNRAFMMGRTVEIRAVGSSASMTYI
jgi:muramoyltetrapeptide carboxypeptidase